MSKFANEEEIKYAHSLLLAGKPFFDQQKIDIIECNETKDVKACPGSGKTTTLLAKLAIIANRMPLPNNQGICVLTHTNVAIEEIKSKLGNKASVLFSYPNHFGTIQSFIDKFVAIPYFNQTSIVPLRSIDDDFAESLCLQAYKEKTFNDKKCIYGEIANRVPTHLKGKEKDVLVSRLMFSKIFAAWYNVFEKSFYRSYGDQRPWVRNADSEVFKLLSSVRLHCCSKGVLKYDDAYSWAFANINSNPNLKDAISHRFNYLFIDEMQDTDDKQLALINDLFKGTIIQCFGDNNQAIYNSVKSKSVWAPTDSLPIDQTMRFGENIAKVLRSVCMEDNRSLEANATLQSLKPILIIYEKPEDVLPKFTSLLQNLRIGNKSIAEIAKTEREMDKLHRNNIKAIGWVGTDRDDVITIKSYYPLFSKDVRKKQKVDYNSLASFLVKKDNASINDYSNLIISAFIYILSLSPTSKNEVNGKSRNFTKTSFIEWFKQHSEDEYENLRTKLVIWSKMICDNKTPIDSILDYLNSVLSPIFSFDTNMPKIKSFLDTEFEEISEEQTSVKNIYSLDGIEIEVNTIHSVKGETHAATLYLETFFDKKYESERIHQQLSGVINTDTNDNIISTLKMAYVGMSRPKYLLCMAVHKDRFTFDTPALHELWNIEKCSQ